MEAVREIVSAELIKPFIDLPWASKDMQVEVIVFPFIEKVTHENQSSGNVNAVQSVLDAITTDDFLSHIADPVAYQKSIRDEWN